MLKVCIQSKGCNFASALGMHAVFWPECRARRDWRPHRRAAKMLKGRPGSTRAALCRCLEDSHVKEWPVLYGFRGQKKKKESKAEMLDFCLYFLLWQNIYNLPIFKDFIYLFLERGEGKEKEWERNIHVWLPLTCPPTGDLACNPGTCPGWESNLWPFGLQTRTQCTEPQQPGPILPNFKYPVKHIHIVV